MKRCERGSLPSVPMPLKYYAKILASYKPIFGKDNPVLLSTEGVPIKIYELIAENEEEKHKFSEYKKGAYIIFGLDTLKDV